jgi:type VI protein secretion system component VasK
MNRNETATIIKDYNEKRKLSTVITPVPYINVDDVYIQTTSIERLDLLAHRFYNDATLWYVIAAANGLGKGSLYVPTNSRLRIPAQSNMQQQTEKTNTTR